MAAAVVPEVGNTIAGQVDVRSPDNIRTVRYGIGLVLLLAVLFAGLPVWALYIWGPLAIVDSVINSFKQRYQRSDRFSDAVDGVLGSGYGPARDDD